MSNCGSCPSKGECNKDQQSCGIQNNPLNNIKKIIGVMSGKGGVGKSTVSALIARNLAKQGYKVGVLDADITGPSIPRLLGVKDAKAMGAPNNCIYPVQSADGIKVMSLNLLLEDENQPVIWRGAMISNTVKQFYTDVIWGELDYLLIDMPPGTGDVALTVMQSIPINGIVMVSVPQDMVSMIVAKAVNMVKKLDIEIIGLVENMSYIVCPDCGKKIQIFNGNDTSKLLDDLQLNLLGTLPMNAGLGNVSVGVYKDGDEEVEGLFNPIVINLLNSLKEIETKKA
ncbi:MAG: Mrp/NBP35 family ATP-binding protein [Intestinibacter bartlettii]|uniref:Mrp/NBP35 family ATP-binding protein n=1 Tax=Intestinibacter bartlettii TaxID=261299 RepID=UPI0026EB569C|nr:Mrp/NBP35 family ATP-binding protein [Intestinibacter bartlettii]MDO5010224.1 Mrp/NBP35 family ATP-binding protein [Intestinibacter bartlettii]